MKRLLICSAFVLISTVLSFGQCVGSCTTVSGTIVDSSTQIWSAATITANIVPPFNNPAQLLNNGSPITSPTTSTTTDNSGNFSFSLDNNAVVTPSGSQWNFTICPNATVNTCSTVKLTITGASMNISTQINNAIALPIVNTSPSIFRAYGDTEAFGGQGAVYWRSIDNTFRGCAQTLCSGSGWVAVGGSGGLGTVTNFSANSTALAALFSTNVTNATTVPSLIFSLVNAPAFSVYGNLTGSPASPSFLTVQGTDSKVLSSGTVSGSAGQPLCTDGNAGATTTGCPGVVELLQVVGLLILFHYGQILLYLGIVK